MCKQHVRREEEKESRILQVPSSLQRCRNGIGRVEVQITWGCCKYLYLEHVLLHFACPASSECQYFALYDRARFCQAGFKDGRSTGESQTLAFYFRSELALVY